MSRPNILFLFADDQRFDTIRALGNEVVHTPYLDALVARGTTFTQAHIPGGTCGAVCMPSRAMLHSGRSLFRLQDRGQEIPAAHTTLGEALRGAGYQTFGTGKWHNGPAAFNRSFEQGDEIFFGGMADHWNVPAFHYDPSGIYASRLPRCVDPLHSHELTWVQADHITAGRHSTELVGGAAVDFLRRADRARPFLCYVSFLAPHDPRTMPAEFRNLYAPSTIPLPPNFLGGHPFDNGALRIRDEELEDFPRRPEAIREHLADYYGMISHLDHQLGRITAVLEERGLLDETIVVFAGDNGLALGQHGLMGKQSCYEHSVRVPLILAGPGIAAGRQTDAYAYLFDLFPTLCELVDVPVPASVEGRSLLPTMAGADRGRETLYLAYTDLQRAVKDRRHKLVEYAVPERDRVTQLFDLEADPWERRNLAADPAQADQVARLRHELLHLRDAWGDPATPFGQRFWARW